MTAYWCHYVSASSDDRTERSQADGWSWAWEEVNAAIQDAGPDVVELLVALADAATDVQALAYLGAGPVESLIRLHGEQFVDDDRPCGSDKRVFSDCASMRLVRR